jgi:hypothetical protein
VCLFFFFCLLHEFCNLFACRLLGFTLGSRCLIAMAFMAGTGMLTTLLRMFMSIDLGEVSRIYIQKYLGVKVPK